ncbi:MAG TPA: choice-of-anchor tandem repeat GloVer-containing protein [Terriglobales bacterium]|nr:choice-of-anchor tandem repeat GloVer-containing protein [Terriglobales bacterium]
MPTKFPHAVLAISVAVLLSVGTIVAAPPLTTLYSFTGGTDGNLPLAGLVADSSGALYGTTSQGGSSGFGVAYKLTPPTHSGDPWTQTVIHYFTTNTGDGFAPEAPLIIDKAGNLYGTTAGGGTNRLGTVFELSPPAMEGDQWTETVLFNFSGPDGAEPLAGLIFDRTGNLYGTTLGGGARGQGTVFELVAPTTSGGAWTESVLYSFKFGADGGNPVAGLVFDKAGSLYGTTEMAGDIRCNDGGGCGVIFKLTPFGGQWTETVIHTFEGPDGKCPVAGLVIDIAGSLYGTAEFGGLQKFGVAFQLTPPMTGNQWTYTVLHRFSGGQDGAIPATSLLLSKSGALYGTTTPRCLR